MAAPGTEFSMQQTVPEEEEDDDDQRPASERASAAQGTYPWGLNSA
jgi:hypothetical protein